MEEALAEVFPSDPPLFSSTRVCISLPIISRGDNQLLFATCGVSKYAKTNNKTKREEYFLTEGFCFISPLPFIFVAVLDPAPSYYLVSTPTVGQRRLLSSLPATARALKGVFIARRVHHFLLSSTLGEIWIRRVHCRRLTGGGGILMPYMAVT